MASSDAGPPGRAHGRDGSNSISSNGSSNGITTNPFPPKTPSPPPPHFLDDNGSSYSSHTLHTIRKGGAGDGGSISGSSNGGDDTEDLESRRVVHVNSSGSQDAEMQAAQAKATSVERRRIVVRALAQLAILFVVCALVMGGTLWLALPDIEDEDKPAFRIPKNFDQLKALNAVLQRYKDENFGRVMLCCEWA